MSTLIFGLRLCVGDEGLLAWLVGDVPKGVLKTGERPCCSGFCSDGGLPITIVDGCLRVEDKELSLPGEVIEEGLEESERRGWYGVRGETAGEMLAAAIVDLRVVDRGLKACSLTEVTEELLDERKRP
jgi:hypothetical protein